MNNLTESKFYNTLIKAEDDNILLCNKEDIYEGAYGSDLCEWDILVKDDNGILTKPNEGLVYSDAWINDLYEMVEEGEDNEGTIYMDCDFEEDKIAVKKVKALDSEIKNLFIDVEHGINTDTICVTDAEIEEGDVYEAPNCTPQVYPSQEYEDAFVFVGEDGSKIYIKRTKSFFEDKDRDVFEEINKEEFEEFC